MKNFRQNPAVNCDSLKEAGILIEGEQPFIRKGKVIQINCETLELRIRIMLFIKKLINFQEDQEVKIMNMTLN